MPIKVLLGEDNLVTQQVLMTMLEGRNYQVAVASTYDELLSQLQKNTYDLLLLDYHLDQDADFILKKIGSLNNDNKSIPVYIMSAGRKEDVIEKLRSFKIDGFIEKPVETEQLLQLLSASTIPTKDGSDEHYIKSIIGDNPDRIQAINSFFLTEVPPALIDITMYLKQRDFSSVKKIVHKIRPAYTYLGKDDIQVKLAKWETDLKEGNNTEKYEGILNDIKQQTDALVATLKQNNQSVTTTTHQQQPNEYPQLSGVSILIVDDNQIIINVFSTLLQTYNITILTAKNGVEGISKTIQKKPQLILMDLHMPEVDGVEAITTIRKEGITTPIIAISNSSNQKDEALMAGANTFLLKPIDASDLLNTIIGELNL
ncbi:MAG: response regulator [Cyclobacteriaceae bacterium]